LSKLPGLPAFHAVREPATPAQRWLTWKDEFELYATALRISDPTQKGALLLHLAGPRQSPRCFQYLDSCRGTRRSEIKDCQNLWTASRYISRQKRTSDDGPTGIFSGYFISW